VKSLAGERLKEIPVGELGLLGDRLVHVQREDGRVERIIADAKPETWDSYCKNHFRGLWASHVQAGSNAG
jgi:uncharacterized protein YcbX